MTERSGVRIRQRVLDVEGRYLGRVEALYESGFAISKGFPILFRRDLVARYDEVRGVREGALVLARTDRDLFRLAEGDVPTAWCIPTPPEFPALATPSEALGVFEGIAGGAISTEPAGWPPEPLVPSVSPPSRGEREEVTPSRARAGERPAGSRLPRAGGGEGHGEGAAESRRG